jgi:hypothetical protein
MIDCRRILPHIALREAEGCGLFDRQAPGGVIDLTASAGARGRRIDDLDRHIPRDVRRMIETRYLAPIGDAGSFEKILRDPGFLDNPVGHPALFADHGVTHARDVARQVLHVLDTVHGRLIPERSADRLGWMKAYGVLLAFMHDVGMIDTTEAGRESHPEVAAREVLAPGFDDVFAALWMADTHGLGGRILAQAGSEAAAKGVLREAIAMALCHSKKKVPVDLLNAPSRLRHLMLSLVQGAALPDGLERAASGRGKAPPSDGEGFAWLTSSREGMVEIAQDVIDTLRALRCADALRMRGTVLKTSGQYEIFIDQRTANALYAFRTAQRHLYLLEVHDPVAVGEANLSGCQFDNNLDLRFSFHHGMFGSAEAISKAASCAAKVMLDIHADAIISFVRDDPQGATGLVPAAALMMRIEAPDDNPPFAELVAAALRASDAAAARRVQVVPSLALASPDEHRRYLSARDVAWGLPERHDVLARIGRCGYSVGKIDPIRAFDHVRLVRLRAGETLVEAGAPSGFVYIPLGEGLHGLPLGEYEEFAVGDHALVGLTGVVRGAARNARIIAQNDLLLLAIPKAVFLENWYFTLDPPTLAQVLGAGSATPR